MNKKLLLSFALAAAMRDVANDTNLLEMETIQIPEPKERQHGISFVVPNSSNGSRTFRRRLCSRN